MRTSSYPFDQRKMDDFRKAEKDAREAKRGLWAEEKPQVKAPPAVIGQTVYATKTGGKYHAEGCRFLAKSMAAVTVEEARKRGLEPCSISAPPK